MLIPVKVFVALSIGWTVAALAFQVVAARGGGRRDHSEPAGSPIGGIAYSFTIAMTPRHKESVSRHPFEFAIGMFLHIGVIVSLLSVVLLLVWPTAGQTVLSLGWPLLALSLAAGVFLLIRRTMSRDLRAMSAPDDYVAILASCGLLALALLYGVAAVSQVVLLLFGGLLFIYIPLGKLRHAVFFFVARGDYGRRLGRRGVLPPAAARTG